MYIFLFAFALAVIGCVIFAYFDRRRSRSAQVSWLHEEKEAGTEPSKGDESAFVVDLSDEGVSCTRPDGHREEVEWKDLRRVELVTTDTGPFLTDVFWVLHGSTTGCVIPQGATGERELMHRLQQLPGFRNEAAIEAMGSTSNRVFVCWEKDDTAD